MIPADCQRATASCGEEGRQSQAYTGRHRSAFVCASVRVRVSVCVRAYLKKQARQSSTHTTTVIDMQMQGICIYCCGHTLHIEKFKHMSMVYMRYSSCTQNAFAKHASDMHIYSHTNIKLTPQCDPHTRCTNKSSLYSKTHISSILSEMSFMLK